jgi:hypothetical protein
LGNLFEIKFISTKMSFNFWKFKIDKMKTNRGVRVIILQVEKVTLLEKWLQSLGFNCSQLLSLNFMKIITYVYELEVYKSLASNQQ